MKRALNIIYTSIMVLVLVFAFLIVGVRLFGLAPYTVLSGSMEPKYHVGSLIYVKKTSAAELKVGDPITYVIGGDIIVTHRIVEIIPDDDNPTVVRYKTKGDANDTADGELVHINNVIGKPVFSIPILGYISYFVQNPPGCYIAIIVIATLVLLSFLPDAFSKILASDSPPADSGEKSEEQNPVEEARKLIAELEKKRAELEKERPLDNKQENGGTEDKPS